ncbi:hypothetical protein ILUMI_02469 [Ignelater luminosus]|uniref:DUF1279 domain-containing protein n=1 Tax=Ignelater luminosus TaxID=2038154 RepID=A0A8K0DI81_IGNLU|nr:hypothetical protein ILUMI_02469 [Ignelater luminosus]
MTFAIPISKNINICFLRTIRNLSIKQHKTLTKRPTYFQRFIKTCREYWYVAIPVHVVTSSVWFAGCYYITQYGFNILKILKRLHVRQDVIDFFTHSDMGHLTVTFALYKLLAPIRIATTIYGSSIAIRHLSRAGLIKPVKNPFRKKKKEKEKVA